MSHSDQIGRTKFLIVEGVSAAGKSALIYDLAALDGRVMPIVPFTTRAPRKGDKKVTVSLAEFRRLERASAFIAVNEQYGALYGPPRWPVEQALQAGRIPVLDWPVLRLRQLETAFGRELLHCVYVLPPSLGDLRARLADRDPTGDRLRHGLEELRSVHRGAYREAVDHEVMSCPGSRATVAQSVIRRYLAACGMS